MFELIIIISLAIIFFIFLARMPEVERIEGSGRAVQLTKLKNWFEGVINLFKKIKFPKPKKLSLDKTSESIADKREERDLAAEAEKKLKFGDLEAAEKLYLRLAVISPRDDKIFAALGKIYSERQNFQDAIASFKAAINRDPKNGFYYYDLANVLYKSGRFEEAILCFEKSILINNRIPNRHLGLGLSLMRMGENEKAAESFKRAIEIEPNNERYKKLLQKTSRRLSSVVEQLHGKE